MRRNRVTNEQLARSGLKVLRGKDLASYAQEGKITSNCVDNVSTLSSVVVGRVAYKDLAVPDLRGRVQG
jgi:hypothetical protein